ncbi:MAG: Holliday junction resolvase RuvX [Bacteriovoracaceae bacterium]|nr:Holliday junction resolvase RuvX [Bacteriovoracaceae bacterium]
MIDYHEISGQTLLGVDYGAKVIGLAMYKVGIEPFPMPFDRIIVSKVSDPIEELKRIVNDEVIDRVIFGLPFLTDGKESTMTHKIKSAGEKLAAAISPIPLNFQDETLSSYEAEERMKNDPRYNFKVDLQKIDALAASIIIEQFLQEQIVKNDS